MTPLYTDLYILFTNKDGNNNENNHQLSHNSFTTDRAYVGGRAPGLGELELNKSHLHFGFLFLGHESIETSMSSL